MEKSQSIKSIAKALGLFQIKMQPLKKDATNPFFKSRYVTLNNILENIEIPLQECELTFTQFPDGDCLTTILIHIPSGEYLQACYQLHPVKQDPQSIGSAITYARRYALGAILALNIDIDDDGNHASGNTQQPTQQHSAPQPEDNRKWLNQFTDKTMKSETIDWTNAVTKLKGGAVKMKNIEAVYKMSKETKLALEKAIA